MSEAVHFICTECHHQVREHQDNAHSGVCLSCRAKAKNIHRTEFLKRLAALPLEERVARIEKELHDVRIEQRLRS